MKVCPVPPPPADITRKTAERSCECAEGQSIPHLGATGLQRRCPSAIDCAAQDRQAERRPAAQCLCRHFAAKIKADQIEILDETPAGQCVAEAEGPAA